MSAAFICHILIIMIMKSETDGAPLSIYTPVQQSFGIPAANVSSTEVYIISISMVSRLWLCGELSPPLKQHKEHNSINSCVLGGHIWRYSFLSSIWEILFWDNKWWYMSLSQHLYDWYLSSWLCDHSHPKVIQSRCVILLLWKMSSNHLEVTDFQLKRWWWWYRWLDPPLCQNYSWFYKIK